LFDKEDYGRMGRLMESVDSLNHHMGGSAIGLVPSVESGGDWRPLQRHLSQGSKTLHFYTGMCLPFDD